HARRNEFEVDGQTLIGYGGSQSLEDPHDYPRITRKLISDLGIDLSRFESAYDRDFYKRNGLQIGFHFDESVYGKNAWVPYPVANPLDENEFAPTRLSPEQATQAMPISESARRQLADILKPDLTKFEANSRTTEVDFLRSLTYRDFIRQHLGATSPEVDRILNAAAVSNFADSIDQISAWGGMSWGGLPGLPWSLINQRIEEEEWDQEPYIYHFPDGNASIARLLVRRLIPQVAPGQSMEDIVAARFNYDRLDESGSPIRLRLDSTVTRVSHVGPAESAEEVEVTYVRGDRAERIRAKQCVLACYSVMIPYLCPEISSPQKEALSALVRAPLIYTTVALRNWRAFAEKKVGWAFSPGLDHQAAALDFPVSLGGQTYPTNPNEPILIHLEGSPLDVDSGLTPRNQYRAARAKMLATPFEDIERSIRSQLAGILSGTEFDPARDIGGITVNRWGHGYAYGYN
ncbi:twin-arginine translocation pathway signal, partial [Myxococcota bacterium]|nr:twin-arginine translocation pathway signal [Myxococcota bacterium]